MRRKDSLNPPEQDPIRALQNQLEGMRSQMIILQNRIATLEAATGTGEVRSQPDETKSAGEPTAFRFKGLALTPGGFLNSTALVRTRNESADVATSYSATPLEGSSNANLSELLLHGDDDQIVPIADLALLSAKIVKNATLKVYRGAPHGMPATFKDHINADLLAFLRQRAGGSVVHGTEDVEIATTLTASGPTIVASQRARRRGRSIHGVT